MDRSPDPEQISQLEAKLRAAALDQRKAALDELATLPAELAVPILKKLAADPDFMRRRLAVMGLGNHQSPAAFEALQVILAQDTDSNVLAEAANSIFEFGAAALPELQCLFERSDNWLVRQTVLSLLLDAERPDLLLEVVRQCLRDEAESVQEAGILALNPLLKTAYADQALVLLSELAQSPDWRLRWRTATALYGCLDPVAKDLLIQLQQDENFRVVAAALDSLGAG